VPIELSFLCPVYPLNREKVKFLICLVEIKRLVYNAIWFLVTLEGCIALLKPQGLERLTAAGNL